MLGPWKLHRLMCVSRINKGQRQWNKKSHTQHVNGKIRGRKIQGQIKRKEAKVKQHEVRAAPSRGAGTAAAAQRRSRARRNAPRTSSAASPSFSFNALSSSSDILIIQFTSVEACKIFSVYIDARSAELPMHAAFNGHAPPILGGRRPTRELEKKITYAQDYTNAENVWENHVFSLLIYRISLYVPPLLRPFVESVADAMERWRALLIDRRWINFMM